MTAGVDLGDKYSYLFVLDNDSGEVVEEGRLRTTPEDFRRRFDSAEPMKIAIEVGTHSTWITADFSELDPHRMMHMRELNERLV